MPKRILQGKVVSDLANKTITVLVERRVMHSVYKKFITRNKKYSAHDENNKFKKGDIVSIIEHRPLSKTKKWLVLDEQKTLVKNDTPKVETIEADIVKEEVTVTGGEV